MLVSAQAQAVAAEETRDALDRAEEEAFFSNSEPEGGPESESGLLVLSNEPEDDDDFSLGSKDSDDELALAAKAGSTFAGAWCQ